MEVIVTNAKELENALESKKGKIIFEGPEAEKIATELEKAQKKKKATKGWAIGIGALCLLAAPFTGGTSLLGIGATAGAVVLTEAIIIAIITGIVSISNNAINAIKEYNIRKLEADRIELIRK